MPHSGNGCGRKRRINKILNNGIESDHAVRKKEGSYADSDVKQNLEPRKQLRSFRRAWKYKISSDILIGKSSDDATGRCTYVSGRTQMACANVCRRSELDSKGFCEIHTRFFRHLKELYIAEQRRNDPGFFTAKILDEDGSLLVSDDDETLLTPSQWPASCEDLYGGWNESDDCHPLQRSGVLSEEECLLIKLALLERKKCAMETYKDLLVEKARRRAAFYKKKVSEEAKKGSVIATNRKERILMQSYRALKNYRHWMCSAFSRYMKRKSDLRLKLKADSKDKFAYLRLASNNFLTKTCAFFAQQVTNVSSDIPSANSANHSIPQFQADSHCLEPVLPGSSYCLRHIAEDKEQKLFSICSSCSAVIADIDSLLCSEKGIKVRVGKDCAFCSKLQAVTDDSVSMASSCDSSLVEENQAKPLGSGTRNIKELSEGYFATNALIDSPELAKVGNEKINRKGRYDENDSLDGNVKYVVIASSDEDGEEVFKLPGEPATTRARFIPGIAPQFSTRNRPFSEAKMTPDTNVKMTMEHVSSAATSTSFSLQKRLNLKIKDTYTCARVRPFHRAISLDEKERKKRKINTQIVAGVSGRYYTSGFLENQRKSIKTSVSSIRPSSSAVQTTLVHHIRTNLSKKPHSSLHILQSQTSGLVPQRINAGPGRASISANSNLQPPKLARVASSTQRGFQSPSYSLLMDPSMISLGPSSSGEVSPHTSKSYCSHSVNRPEMQQDSSEVLLRTSSNLPQTYIRSVNTPSADEGRRFTYKSYSAIPRIVPSYLPHTSIIVSNSNSLPSFRSIQQSQYTEKTIGAERQNSSEQYYRRTDRSFTSGQGVRSRFAFIESSRNPFHSASYSPYQGNSITSRMREVPRTEFRHFSKYETYVDPFATDSRLPRNAFDTEAAAAVASIVNERSDVDDTEALEANNKTNELDFGSMKSTARQHIYSSEVIRKESVPDSLSNKKVVDMTCNGQPDVSACNISESTSQDKFKCDESERMSPKISAQDRHEDGLAVLALAAESHAAVRSRNSVVTSSAETSAVIPAGQDKTDSNIITVEKSSKQVSIDGEHHNCAPYKILGFEEEDEDDF